MQVRANAVAKRRHNSAQAYLRLRSVLKSTLLLNKFGLVTETIFVDEIRFFLRNLFILASHSFLLIEGRSLKPLDVLEKLIPCRTRHKCCIKSSQFIHYISNFIHHIDSDIFNIPS